MASRGGHQWSGAIQNQLLARELTGCPVTARPFLADFSCQAPVGGSISVNPGGMMSPPFTVRYNKCAGFNQGKWIAVGDEEGYVHIMDGKQRLPDALCPAEPDALKPTAQWLAHHNAIFDLAWFQDDERMLTASGDQCVHLWDTATARGLGQFRGHNGSVKSVCPHASHPAIFASGARDGALMVWDARSQQLACQRSGTAYQAPVLVVQDAHKDVSGKAPKRRRKFGPMDTKHTVTSVVFLQQDHIVASSGDRGTVVKFWDLRKAVEPAAAVQLPQHDRAHSYLLPSATAECLAKTSAQSVGKRQHGVTCLALSPQGTRLLVSCSSSVHYLFDTGRPDLGPLGAYSGHVSGSFYIRACFSGDGAHILSGSSNHQPHIWAVDRPGDPPLVLDGNAGEVTGVAWCPTDLGQIATCHDDATVCVWELDRARAPRAAPRLPVLPATLGACLSVCFL